MKKLIPFIAFGLLILFASGLLYKRFDLTSDKRFTLAQATKDVVNSVNEPLLVDVYLEGDFPADFQQFKQEIQNTLDQFQSENSDINYRFINPIEESISEDTLQAIGMSPSILPETKDGKISQIKIYPYALFKYKGFADVVPLFTAQQVAKEDLIKASLEELEYKFSESIQHLQTERVKKVGFVNNHQSLSPIQTVGMYQKFIKKYDFQPLFNPDSANVTLKKKDLELLNNLQALVIAKPREPFTDEEKLVLDQYIMNGGKVLWMLDAINAEKDSLMRSGKITAFTNDMNLNDILFSYGVRMNGGIIKDYQKAGRIKVQTGEIQGNKEYAMPQWPYLPLGIAEKTHPITKNLNPVLFQFASPIDTLDNGIQKTVLYQSSSISDVIPTPNFIYLEDVVEATNDSLLTAQSHNGNKITAILLEGKFKSAYAGRFERQEIPDFKAESNNNKMILISDGDVAKNDVMQGKTPVPLGIDALTGINYGNADFLENCLDYLLDDSGLMELRNRTIDQRLLDNQKILSQKTQWQSINLIVPILFIALIALVLLFWKRRMVLIK